jgi:hypothetical protein
MILYGNLHPFLDQEHTSLESPKLHSQVKIRPYYYLYLLCCICWYRVN